MNSLGPIDFYLIRSGRTHLASVVETEKKELSMLVEEAE